MDSKHLLDFAVVVVLVEIAASLPCRGFCVDFFDELGEKIIKLVRKNLLSIDLLRPIADGGRRQRLSSPRIR